jgi:hypothetical protein
VAKIPLESTYSEPTIMWRICNTTDGRRGFAVIVPQGSKAKAGWFSQGIPQESRTFVSWHAAMCWLEAKLVTLELHDWHLQETQDS